MCFPEVLVTALASSTVSEEPPPLSGVRVSPGASHVPWSKTQGSQAPEKQEFGRNLYKDTSQSRCLITLQIGQTFACP